MAEKRGISPVVVIAGALGLGAIGLLALVALARAAPGVPPEPPPGYANLYGVITDLQTGEPIAGVQGTVYQDYDTDTESYDFTTNSQGYYEIRNMLAEVDVTKMVVYADGYQTHTDEDIDIGEGNNELNIQMTPA